MSRGEKRPAEDFEPEDLIFEEQKISSKEENIEIKDNFFTPAFPVASFLSNPDGPPQDGLEYLLTVRNETKRLPKVVIAKNRPPQNNIAISAQYISKNVHASFENQFLKGHNFISQVPLKDEDRVRPDPEWQVDFLTSFRKHKNDFQQLLKRQPPSKVCTSFNLDNLPIYLQTSPENNLSQEKTLIPPTPAHLASLTPPQVIKLLKHFTSNFKISNSICEIESQWIYGILLRLDDLIVADDMVILRELARSCLDLRLQSTATVELILRCNTIITIVSHHFGQLDLSP